MSADPSITALIAAGGGGDPLQGTIAAVERAGKVGKIHVVSTDFLADLGERLENGSMTASTSSFILNASNSRSTRSSAEISEGYFPSSSSSSEVFFKP